MLEIDKHEEWEKYANSVIVAALGSCFSSVYSEKLSSYSYISFMSWWIFFTSYFLLNEWIFSLFQQRIRDKIVKYSYLAAGHASSESWWFRSTKASEMKRKNATICYCDWIWHMEKIREMFIGSWMDFSNRRICCWSFWFAFVVSTFLMIYVEALSMRRDPLNITRRHFMMSPHISTTSNFLTQHAAVGTTRKGNCIAILYVFLIQNKCFGFSFSGCTKLRVMSLFFEE